MHALRDMDACSGTVIFFIQNNIQSEHQPRVMAFTEAAFQCGQQPLADQGRVMPLSHSPWPAFQPDPYRTGNQHMCAWPCKALTPIIQSSPSCDCILKVFSSNLLRDEVSAFPIAPDLQKVWNDSNAACKRCSSFPSPKTRQRAARSISE